MRAFVLLCASILPVQAVASETVRLCDQKVEYTLVPPGSDLSPAARALHGIWTGTAMFPVVSVSDVEMCIAFVVEELRANGAVRTRYVWGDRHRHFSNGASYAIRPGVTTWNGKMNGDALDLMGTNSSGRHYAYQLRANGSEMLGTFFTPNGNGRAVLKRK